MGNPNFDLANIAVPAFSPSNAGLSLQHIMQDRKYTHPPRQSDFSDFLTKIFPYCSLPTHAKKLKLARAIRTAPETADSAPSGINHTKAVGVPLGAAGRRPPRAAIQWAETAANGRPLDLVSVCAAAELSHPDARPRTYQ